MDTYSINPASIIDEAIDLSTRLSGTAFPINQEKSTNSKKLVTSILGKDEYFKTALPTRS